MKNTRSSAKKEMHLEKLPDLAQPDKTKPKYEIMGPDSFGGSDFQNWDEDMDKIMRQVVDPFDNAQCKGTLDPDSIGDFPPIATPEQIEAMNKVYAENPVLRGEDDSWIQTYTGKKFYPLNPGVEDICIEDIAHALSMQCRFTGHCKFHYSIAQHSVLVSYLSDDKDRMHALLHDASEAYICDLSSPLKRSVRFAEYRKIESVLQAAILRKFGLDEKEPSSVKTADLTMLGIEAKTLLFPIHPEWKLPIKPPPFAVIEMSPQEAEKIFLDRFYDLINSHN